MKILIDVNHPAHIHYFKNFIKIMENKGHRILVISRDLPIMINLLDFYKITYKLRVRRSIGFIGKFKYIFLSLLFDFKYAMDFKPDLFLGFASFFTSFTSFLLNKPNIIFDDTEHNSINHFLYKHFTDIICTPACFRKKISTNHIKFNGYMELSYLHPKYYKPDPSILKKLGVDKEEDYIIFRFISWDASHDFGQKGLNSELKIKLIGELSKYAKIFISAESENDIPLNLRQYQMCIPPEQMHDVLAYANLFVGEGATMAAECAILGTPAIYINKLQVGYCLEQEKKYGLVYNFLTPEGVLGKAIELISSSLLKKEFQKKSQQLQNEKIDVTDFMVWVISNYPASKKILLKRYKQNIVSSLKFIEK